MTVLDTDMASDLQRIASGLAARLGRSVAIDDPRMRLQAYSSHYEPVDPVRLASILHREAPEKSTRWVLSLGIAEAQEPVRVPANPELEMQARVCVPIRHQGQLLGYLWLLDPDSSLTDQELALAGAAAESAGVVMHGERLLGEIERGRERELLRDLLADDTPARRHAAEELVEANLFSASVPVAVAVVHPGHGTGEGSDEAVRLSIGRALEHLRRYFSPRCSLQLARPEHGLMVVSMRDPVLRTGGLLRPAEELRSALLRDVSGEQGKNVVVGIGGTRGSLEEAVGSYREALEAIRVMRIVPSFGPIAEWSQLGIYRLLSQFPVEKLTADTLHPGLMKLLESRDSEPLLDTLEHYLDRGCDAKATAADLHLHRASLYYRLHKIEETTGASLKNGEDRLALHLGLKLARLAGIRSGSPARGGEART